MRTCPFCAEAIQDAAIVCKHCGRDLPSGPTTATATAERPRPACDPSTTPVSQIPSKRRTTAVRVLGLLVILLALVVYRLRQGAGRGGVAGIVTPPRVTQLAMAQQIDVRPGSVQRWQWDVSPAQPMCRLTGHIEVTDGGSHDVQVFVMTADDYANFANGHPARALYQTEKTTAVSLDVRTSSPGPKVLAISNAFSVLTGKRVDLRAVQVICQ